MSLLRLELEAPAGFIGRQPLAAGAHGREVVAEGVEGGDHGRPPEAVRDQREVGEVLLHVGVEGAGGERLPLQAGQRRAVHFGEWVLRQRGLVAAQNLLQLFAEFPVGKRERNTWSISEWEISGLSFLSNMNQLQFY